MSPKKVRTRLNEDPPPLGWEESQDRRPRVRGGSFISIFDLVALLLTLAALFSWLNHRLLGLPHSIGLLGLGLLASLALVGLERVVPDASLAAGLTNGLRQINFTDVVMNGMLAFLLFAGVLSLNLEALRDRAWPIGILAVVGTVISTGLVGPAFWFAANSIGQPLSLPWALVFGALISPTDPVAVLSALKSVRIPASLEIEMQGEALFNDGVGIVLFTLLVGVASNGGTEPVGVDFILRELLQEAGGGVLLGVVTRNGSSRSTSSSSPRSLSSTFSFS